MKLKIALILGVVALAGTGLWFVMTRVDHAPSPAGGSSDSAKLKPKPVSKAVPAGRDAPPAKPRLDDPDPARLPPAVTVPAAKAPEPGPARSVGAKNLNPRAEYMAELEKVQFMLRDYRSIMLENPVGTNAEIMKSLMGGNPRGAQLGPPGGQGINASGELVDQWGTPYFFHQMSGTHMEIRSAGPDRTMWTLDDVVQN